MEKPSTLLPNSGKRGPTCSLSGSSSSEGEGSDQEDIPPSPCSSTSSGPTYVRPPGFTHHGQEIKVDHKPKVNVRIKRKIKRQSMMKDVLPKSHVTSHPVVSKGAPKEEKGAVPVLPPSSIGGMKTKVRKEPIPMRLRALPQSFWQQPNTVNSASPGSMYSVLPPLCKMEQSNSDLSEVRPVTPLSDVESADNCDSAVGQLEIKKEMKERTELPVEKESLRLDLGRERDNSQERELSPRDREVSPRDMKETSPRDRDLTPRDRDLTPRDREGTKDRESVRDKEVSGTETREARPVPAQLPPEARMKQPRPPPRIVKVSPANTELLAKLFESVDGEGKKKIVRRGRPKREYNPQAAALAAAASNTSNNNSNAGGNASSSSAAAAHHHPCMTGGDPYMIDNVAEGLLPMLSLETSRQNNGPSSHLSIISIRGDNDRMLSLPSLSVEQNHSAILSELVKAL
ncbi:uncharacterized protein [Diadema antillarum]|uniref:uncharacterized protein n=1 Tax=Diadema antillarum TaxID=105358 RepID=UPI003A86F960